MKQAYVEVKAPAPVAAFSGDNLKGSAPLTVAFRNESTGQVDRSAWEFGDGASGGQTHPTHTYTEPGVYAVTLVVSNPSGSDTLTRSGYVQVNGGEIPMEVGEVSVDHEWQRVDFTKSFSDPVVVAKPISNNGGQQATVRISGIDTTGFWVRVQEWDYLDGWHAVEQLSYVVMERGYHQLPGGAWVEAGRIQSSGNSAYVAAEFTAPFGEAPVVFATVTSTNEADAVVTRSRNISTAGFEVTLQEQERNAQQHLPEGVDYIAWEPSFGVVNDLRYEVGLTDARVSDQPYTLLYKGVFDQAPLFLADMQTTLGGDTANLRWNNRTEVGLEVWVSEEQSRDSETGHVPEAVGYLVVYVEVDTGGLRMEVGEVSVDHEWQRVDFTKSFSDPIVVAKPISNNGGHQATVRMSGVDSQGFWIRVQEWDYLDGWHAVEQVSFVVMERGYHQLPDGAWVEAGGLRLTRPAPLSR